jgi:uncharacterized membrane protein
MRSTSHPNTTLHVILRLFCVFHFPTASIAYQATKLVFHRRQFFLRRQYGELYPASMDAFAPNIRYKQNCMRSFSSNQSRFQYVDPSYQFSASFTTRTQLRSVESSTSVLMYPNYKPMLSSVFAACSLVYAAWMGFFSERQLARPLFPSCGIVVSLFVASLLSSFLNCVPKVHPIYDYCWSTILPASLALLLLSLPSNQNARCRETTSKFSLSDNSVFGVVRRLSIPFLFACIGSILGCTLSYLMCYHYPLLLLTPFDACQAAACLVASYIGGSVNFFATAAAIRQLPLAKSLKVGSSSMNHSTLMSAMCAVDIVVMAVYFALLSVALQSERLQRWFQSEPSTSIASIFPEDDRKATARLKQSSTEELNYDSLSYRVPAVLVCGLLALFFVHISKRLESMVNHIIPGTACGFLCIFVPYFTRRMSAVPWVDNSSLWRAIQHFAEPMSLFSFLLLFGSIGITADVSSAISSGPACLCFSLAAIATHGFVTLFGSYLWKRAFAKRFLNCNNQFDLADVLIASNAAIGGPATAAAFCGQIPKQSSFQRKRSLSIAATVWGVVGYAFGTTIGVSMYKLLQYFV